VHEILRHEQEARRRGQDHGNVDSRPEGRGGEVRPSRSSRHGAGGREGISQS
jgi:hypothetical protein